MKKTKATTRLTSLALVLALLLTSCEGGGASATTMHLRKTEGTVGVSDSEGKDVDPKDNLGLYSGYQVGTRAESYAWIDLDEVKLTKMDADSEIEVVKDGKKLEINVKSGSLFFNITEPLEDDETLDIRTSSMLVGIRGTCGWVTENTAALLEGTVEVTAGEQTVTVTAGEMAVMTDGTLEVKPFTAASVPAFVREEIADDEDLAATIQDTTGMDLIGDDPLAFYADVLSQDFGEVQYTEFVDFAGDGLPELVVIGIHSSPIDDWHRALVAVYPDVSTEGPIYILAGFNNFETSADTYLAFENNCSLVESDGKLFLKVYQYQSYQYQMSNNTYQNSGEFVYFESFNDDEKWSCEQIDHINNIDVDTYSLQTFVLGDSQAVTRDIDPGEYAAIQAKYREVKLLAHNLNGEPLIIDAL